jgi:hypothetical protein
MTIIRTFTERKVSSQYLGVFLKSGKWLARITVNGRRILLGMHETEEQAGRAYNNAALLHHGVFARLNVLKSEPRKECRNAL